MATIRAAWWARRAARVTRRSLRTEGVTAAIVPPPPALPDHAHRGVVRMLRHTDATCLERSMVVQAWDRAHGRPRDLVVGVTAPRAGFRAHAWLEGDPPSASEGFQELFRRSAT